MSKNKKQIEFVEQLEKYFDSSTGTTYEKLSNFTKFAPRQHLTKFISKYEIFKKIIGVEGAIIECGVRFGGGLMTFAQLSSIFEPVNYTRKIVGFDTFSGFPGISKNDFGSKNPEAHKGGMAVNSFNDLKQCIELYDSNRFLSDYPKIELIKGDAVKTIPKYIKENPHTVVSLLYLDFDIYKPTKVALENFIDRMPKGAIIAFDELNDKNWKGETLAVLETVGIKNLKIQRFNFDTFFSYAVIE
jgi:hypothetical protein|tara:strand:+ start:3087 stop:3818 length:732 start_codon:yes stop_codon:yes gene_type:complete